MSQTSPSCLMVSDGPCDYVIRLDYDLNSEAERRQTGMSVYIGSVIDPIPEHTSLTSIAGIAE